MTDPEILRARAAAALARLQELPDDQDALLELADAVGKLADAGALHLPGPGEVIGVRRPAMIPETATWAPRDDSPTAGRPRGAEPRGVALDIEPQRRAALDQADVQRRVDRYLDEAVEAAARQPDSHPVVGRFAADGQMHGLAPDVHGYEPRWQAQDVDYDASWEIRADGRRIGGDRMRGSAQLAAWQQMRTTMPREHWSVEACDAITEAVLRVVRDWVAAP